MNVIIYLHMTGAAFTYFLFLSSKSMRKGYTGSSFDWLLLCGASLLWPLSLPVLVNLMRDDLHEEKE